MHLSGYIRRSASTDLQLLGWKIMYIQQMNCFYCIIVCRDCFDYNLIVKFGRS